MVSKIQFHPGGGVRWYPGGGIELIYKKQAPDGGLFCKIKVVLSRMQSYPRFLSTQIYPQEKTSD